MSAIPRQVYFRTPRKTKPEAPLFVFLPGLDGTGELLRVQTEGLEPTFDIRCLAIPPTDMTGWDQLAEQVLALIRTELEGEHHRPIYLCGESFGGCLAMKVALRSPQLFHRIILVNPASSFARRPWMQWGSLVTQWLPEPLYELSCYGLLPFLSSLGQIEAGDRRALIEAMLSVPQQASIWRLSLLREFRVTANQLKQLKQPVLLIGSRRDRLLSSASEVQILARHLPNARVLILPNSGHACLLESDINLYQMMRDRDFMKDSHSMSLEGSTAVFSAASS
ncbi:alpha/beta hydrolase [Oculatella sp. FACHB-28]|uniref:alpha/beta fold hydrolase n=1 Tax=Oculatella sp. FACHB-28 TaxID=2692845 RepID=UPI0016830759|nr:alpha/beta hydrolase [Oculatella sp. FACHB-28]MBD2058462.1 alpha/beta hydrolase [Oculatella sp. FACHB-28]